jgi:L-fuconolactonase
LSATINAAAAFWWAAIVATIGSRDVLIRYATRWNALWQEPNMQIVDAQVHAYERNHPGRPWVGHLHGPPSATGDEMVAAMDAIGVDGALLVSPYSLYRFDASYALEVGAAHPGRFGLIKPVDPYDPVVEKIMADWAKTKGAVAIPLLLLYGTSEDPADPGMNRESDLQRR